MGFSCATIDPYVESLTANVTFAMTTPTFSVIVPTFNAGTTLRACLDGLVAQTSSDFEVVLVDGASADQTVEIAKSYTSVLGQRLVLHSGPDQGPYDAMNRGVSMATGQWVLFLGADDTLRDAETLAQVADFIGAHEHSDIVYGDVMRRSTSTRHAGEFDLDRLLFETNICHQAIFYRRELFAGIGPYNLRYPVWADWDFNIRCFSNPALVTRYMDIVVANYNDLTGLSGKTGTDTEFRKRLPMYFWYGAKETSSRMLGHLKKKELRRLIVRQLFIRRKVLSGGRAPEAGQTSVSHS
jgi:glycosyltransferase involved in cell wall biosynthesis